MPHRAMASVRGDAMKMTMDWNSGERSRYLRQQKCYDGRIGGQMKASRAFSCRRIHCTRFHYNRCSRLCWRECWKGQTFTHVNLRCKGFQRHSQHYEGGTCVHADMRGAGARTHIMAKTDRRVNAKKMTETVATSLSFRVRACFCSRSSMLWFKSSI